MVKVTKTIQEKKARKENSWVAHCKKYATDNKVTYKEAVSQGKTTYKKVVKEPTSSLEPPKLVREYTAS